MHGAVVDVAAVMGRPLLTKTIHCTPASMYHALFIDLMLRDKHFGGMFVSPMGLQLEVRRRIVMYCRHGTKQQKELIQNTFTVYNLETCNKLENSSIHILELVALYCEHGYDHGTKHLGYGPEPIIFCVELAVCAELVQLTIVHYLLVKPSSQLLLGYSNNMREYPCHINGRLNSLSQNTIYLMDFDHAAMPILSWHPQNAPKYMYRLLSKATRVAMEATLVCPLSQGCDIKDCRAFLNELSNSDGLKAKFDTDTAPAIGRFASVVHGGLYGKNRHSFPFFNVWNLSQSFGHQYPLERNMSGSLRLESLQQIMAMLICKEMSTEWSLIDNPGAGDCGVFALLSTATANGVPHPYNTDCLVFRNDLAEAIKANPFHREQSIAAILQNAKSKKITYGQSYLEMMKPKAAGYKFGRLINEDLNKFSCKIESMFASHPLDVQKETVRLSVRDLSDRARSCHRDIKCGFSDKPIHHICDFLDMESTHELLLALKVYCDKFVKQKGFWVDGVCLVIAADLLRCNLRLLRWDCGVTSEELFTCDSDGDGVVTLTIVLFRDGVSSDWHFVGTVNHDVLLATFGSNLVF